MEVVVLGNLADGYTFHGPFKDAEAAFEFADARPEFMSWVATLEVPEIPTLVDEEHSALAAMLQRVYELATISAFTGRDKDYVAEFHDFVVNCPWLEDDDE